MDFGQDVGGYVLAGGKSSRMGQDKALLKIAGKPLALHAVTKLGRVCSDVHILSDRHELTSFAPLVTDLHGGCGPLGGIEAALRHSPHEWNLFMPVDMPFIPTSFLFLWIQQVSILEKRRGGRISMFTVFDRPQPLFCQLHREVAPFVYEAMERGEYKVLPVMEMAGKKLAERQGSPFDMVFCNLPWGENSSLSGEIEGEGGEVEEWRIPTDAQQAARHLWFANLNTPEEFAEAERHLDALDT
jgi:molybdopterin-guanine dinucleotide biosynthesis protein A